MKSKSHYGSADFNGRKSSNGDNRSFFLVRYSEKRIMKETPLQKAWH